MPDKSIHTCKKLQKISGHFVKIEKLGNNWYIWFDDEATLKADYCPCCGEKLA